MCQPYAHIAEHESALLQWMRLIFSSDEGQEALLTDILQREDVSAAQGVLLPFAQLCIRFSLSPVERFFLLCAWQETVTLPQALQMICPDEGKRILQSQEVTMRRSVLGLLFSSETPLRLHPRITVFLRDPLSLPDFPCDILWPQDPPALCFAREIPDQMLRAVTASAEPGECLLYLSGLSGMGKRTQAHHLACKLDTPILAVDASGTDKLDDVIRECLLWGAFPCICHADALFESSDTAHGWISVLLHRFGLLILCGEGEDPACLREFSPFYIPLPMPDFTARLALWQSLGLPLSQAELSAVSGKFTLRPGQIKLAAQYALHQQQIHQLPAVDAPLLHSACRRQLTQSLSEKAFRVTPVFRWENLILPAPQKQILRTAIDQVQNWQTVLGEWGLEAALPYGRGLSILFSGPPGTGKTMAAQVMAAELMMDLYQVDLSVIVSKYVGDTQRNLRQVFDEVAGCQGILFFDEADALFGKRTELKDAQDRYANMEAAYLLQRIEAYQGIVILATNIYQNFDEAFRRRIKFVVDFPFPDGSLRKALWEKALPPGVPKGDDLDYAFLSRFELSGSYIRNISINAAYLAAAQDRPVCMEHVLRALRMEMQKMGKALLREDLGEYLHLIREDTP